MRVAQIICRFKPYKGGMGNLAHDYALGLAKLGHEVTVFTPLYDKNDNDFAAQEFAIKRLKPLFKFGNAAFLPQLFWQLKNFDIVHLHYPFFGGAEIVWLLKILAGAKMKLIITYHMDVVGSGWLKYFFKFNARFIIPRIIRAADKVIVTSFDYAQNSNIANVLKAQPEKFVAIPPGVDLNRFFSQPKDFNILAKYNLDNEDKILLFVGALDKAHYFKGIEFLITIFVNLSLKNLKLLIVGQGELREKYLQQAKELNFSERIIFADPVSDNDLPKYYNLADAVILPSIDKSEAWGMVLTEAMACAKPVIASDLPGVRSVFANGQEGYVFAIKNEQDLNDKIKQLFANESLRLKMGLAACAKAKQLYDPEKLINKINDLYLEVVK